MTITNVSAGALIDPAWGNAVANQLNADTEWTTYTPVLAEGASSNISKTVTWAEYTRSGPTGKTITVIFAVSATAAGTAGSSITISLPVTAANLNGISGSGAYLDNGTQSYAGVIVGVTTTTIALQADSQFGSTVGITPNIAVASGDVYRGTFVYKAA